MTRAVRFTAWTIQTLRVPPGHRRAEYRDTDVPGLYVRISRSGTKTFSVIRRPAGGGRARRITVGRFPGVSVDEARKQARHLVGLLAGSERSSDRKPIGATQITLREALGRFLIERREQSEAARRYAGQVESVFRRHIEPHFGKRTLAEIRRTDLVRWHERLPELVASERTRMRALRERALARGEADFRLPRGARTTPTDGRRSANYALSVMRTLLQWALDSGLLTGDNPARGVGRHREPPRGRYLLPEELTRLFSALAAERHADFFLLALITGVRRSALLAMRWPDLDLALGEWWPGGRDAHGGSQVVLVPQAVEILQQRARLARAAPADASVLTGFVFPSRSRSGHLADPHRAWRRLLARAGLEDLRIQDLRRTLGVWQMAAGASLALVARSLGHTTLQASARYARLADEQLRDSVQRATGAMFGLGTASLTGQPAPPNADPSSSVSVGAQSPRGPS